LLLLRNLFFLEYKEKILLKELVIKFSLFAIVQVRLVNINVAYISSISRDSYVYICRASAARGNIGS
jgi:hypothetical protein